MKLSSTSLALLLFSAGLTPTGAAAPTSAPAAGAPFPFVLPWDDSASGTATDVSSLNVKPAGAHGFIVSRGGRFVESNTGTRVRFLGTNFAAKAAFPSHADAEKVAARIAKLGINIVRMHHMDNPGWGPGATIWDQSRKDRLHIDPAQLDKLDYLIAQFKRNGVYANINLHVSRQFSDADGFPASVNQIPFSFDKRVDEFDRRMISLQKDYARDLLTHVNPYTHLTYAADPAVAVVEINNENSLVGDPWATLGADLGTLPEPFRGELVGFWNDWLLKKYGTDVKLQAAWLRGISPPGPSILPENAQWSLEHQGTSQAAMTFGDPTASDTKVTIDQVDGTDWHVQAHPTGLDFREGGTYTVSFRAKADKPRTINVGAGLDQADYHNIGLSENPGLTTDWKTFRYVFSAHEVAPQHGRVSFTLGSQTGTLWIADLQVRPGAEGAGLQPGQSLTARSVDIPASTTRAEHGDWIAFLADTERSYAEEMRSYLKNTLHVHANIICSQISWGGLTGLNRETAMDFADNHAYWQHPSFPHKPWDSQDWVIPNTAMVSDLADGKGGTLRDLAEYRVAGKPYTVSEYNHPAPNDFQAEMMPEIATFAAFQDWDIVYLFDYGDYGTGVANDQINGYFGIGSNPAKTAFLPAAAMIFRAGQFPAASPAVTAPVSAALLRSDGTDQTAWAATGTKIPDLWRSRIALSPRGAVRAATVPPGPAASLVIAKTPLGGQFIASSANAQSLAGFVGGQTVALGPLQLTFPHFGNDFAAATLTKMPSGSLLLTLAGKVENQGMVWNAARTSVGDQWGHGPAMAEGIPATVALRATGPRRVFALDPTGKRAQTVTATFAGGTLTFMAGPQHRTVWYEIAP